jgi:hypothetical protein
MLKPRYLVPVMVCLLGLSVPCLADTWKVVNQLHGWRVSCKRDMMTDQVSCLANNHQGLSVLLSGPTREQAVILGVNGRQYPGESCWLRIDMAPAQRDSGHCVWAESEASGIIAMLLRGQQLRTRYTGWPSKLPVDAQVSLEGFPAVWAALQAAYAAQ